MASRNKAFTLIELLAVIAIISILAGFVYTGAEKAIEKAKVTKTRSTIDSLATALFNFERDMGSYDADVGNEKMPVGELKNDQDRIKLVRILTGKEMMPDGSFQIARDIREDQRWNGPYLDPKPKELTPKLVSRFKPGQLVDAWGNPLMIRIKRETYDKMMRYRPDSFEVWSWGPNETDEITKSGSGDDITNWE